MNTIKSILILLIFTFSNSLHSEERHQTILDIAIGLETDYVKFFSQGNKAAGTRVEAGLDEIQKLLKDYDKELRRLGVRGRYDDYSDYPLIVDWDNINTSDRDLAINLHQELATGIQEFTFIYDGFYLANLPGYGGMVQDKNRDLKTYIDNVLNLMRDILRGRI